ncbi:MAG: hypothetical protein GY863_11065, partial [bacterium]|nr:hypothetical protein [bacterium]
MQLRFIAIVSIILFVSCATFSSNRKVSDEIEIPEAWNPDIGQGESA